MKIKAKTKKAASKRFKVTSKGKIMRGNALTSHLQRKKSAARKRRQAVPKEVFKADAARLERMLHI